MTTLRDHIAGEVVFKFYKDGNLWYETGETGFQFPVPIDDIGNATFLARDKGMMFMRYIRKHLAVIAAADNSGLSPTQFR